MIGLDDAYHRFRKLLFHLEPETAQALVLALVRLGRPFAENVPVSLEPVKLAGLSLNNRIGLAAGLDKNAKAIVGLARLGFGFIEVGAATPEPQSGNPKPRVFRLEENEAVINRLGFNNDGVEKIARRVARSRHLVNIPIGVNIGKNRATPNEHALGDYLTCCEALFDVTDYLSVNISSPNTPGLRDLQTSRSNYELLNGIVQRCWDLGSMKGKQTPVFVKISPDLSRDELIFLVETIRQTGCDGIIATNTTLSRDGVTSEMRHEEGGLSGKPLNAIACKTIKTIREVAGEGYPIIGVGGISDRDSMHRLLDAGANAVQVYSGLIYRGPSLVRELAKP